MNASLYNAKKMLLDLSHQLGLEKLKLEALPKPTSLMQLPKEEQEAMELEDKLRRQQIEVEISLLEINIEKARKQVLRWANLKTPDFSFYRPS